MLIFEQHKLRLFLESYQNLSEYMELLSARVEVFKLLPVVRLFRKMREFEPYTLYECFRSVDPIRCSYVMRYFIETALQPILMLL